MTIRRLNVPVAFLNSLEEQAIPADLVPTINRDGWYQLRRSGNTWIEYCGKAYTSDTKEFNHAFKLASPRMDPRLYAALGAVISFGVNTPEQLEGYLLESERRALRIF